MTHYTSHISDVTFEIKSRSINRNSSSWNPSEPLNRWYTAAPWRPEAGQRHHGTSSAVSTFQLASRSTNSCDYRTCQFLPTDTCVRLMICSHPISFYHCALFTNPFVRRENPIQARRRNHSRSSPLLNVKERFALNISDALCRTLCTASFQHKHWNFTEYI